MSPKLRRRSPANPCTTCSFTEMQRWQGYFLYPRNALFAPCCPILPAANSSICFVVIPGRMNSQTSSSTVWAITQAGRIKAKSCSVFKTTIDLSHPAIRLEPAAQPALLQEAVVMAHQQMRFHLPHGVQHHTHKDQNARPA